MAAQKYSIVHPQADDEWIHEGDGADLDQKSHPRQGHEGHPSKASTACAGIDLL